MKITLHSEDIAHSLTIDGYRIAKRVGGGQTVTFEFRADQPGTFPIYCNLTPGRRLPADARRAGRQTRDSCETDPRRADPRQHAHPIGGSAQRRGQRRVRACPGRRSGETLRQRRMAVEEPLHDR